MWPPMFPCGTTQGYAYVARAIVWPCHTASSGLKASLGALLIDLKTRFYIKYFGKWENVVAEMDTESELINELRNRTSWAHDQLRSCKGPISKDESHQGECTQLL